MFDELDKYKDSNHFFLMPNGDLERVCNAPADKSGVYVVYALKNGKIRMVYIGRSGERMADGSMFIRQTGLGGIKDRIVNGHHLGKIPAKTSWINRIKEDKIEALDIYWWVTHNNEYTDCPKELRKQLLQNHKDLFECLPAWNSKL